MTVDSDKSLAALARFGETLHSALVASEQTIAARRRLDAPALAIFRRDPAGDRAWAEADAAIERAAKEFEDAVRPLAPIIDAILQDILDDRVRLLAEALDACVMVKNAIDPDPRRGRDFGELHSPVDGAPLLRRDRVFLGKGIPEPIAGRSVHDPAVIALRETLAPLAAIRALYGPELRRINKGN